MTAFDRAWDVVKSQELLYTDEIPKCEDHPYGAVVEHWGGVVAHPFGEDSDLPEQTPHTGERETAEPQTWFWNWCDRRIIQNDANGMSLGKVITDDRGRGMRGYNSGRAISRTDALEKHGVSPMSPYKGGYIYGLRIDPSTLRPESNKFIADYDKPYASAFNEIYSGAMGIDPLPEDKDDEWDDYIEGGKGR